MKAIDLVKGNTYIYKNDRSFKGNGVKVIYRGFSESKNGHIFDKDSDLTYFETLSDKGIENCILGVLEEIKTLGDLYEAAPDGRPVYFEVTGLILNLFQSERRRQFKYIASVKDQLSDDYHVKLMVVKDVLSEEHVVIDVNCNGLFEIEIM